MNPLLRRLAVLRVKVRLLDGWQGVCALVAAIVGIGFAVGMLDYWAHLPNLIRAVALVGLLIGSGAIAYRYLLRPLTRSCDDLSLALRVEDEFPELNDALASTVQFLKQSKEDESRVGLSPAMRERAVKETIARAAGCDFGRILDRRGSIVFGVAALGIVLAAGFVANANRAYAGIAFWRLVEPFGPHTWTTVSVSRQAPLEMIEEDHWEPLDPDKNKDRIAIGRPYRIKVDIGGQIPKHAKVEIEGQMIRSDKLIELKPSADKSASFEHYVDMTQQRQKFKFRVLANDGSFPPRAGSWHEVEVVPPPKLVDLDNQPSPQITLYPPLYTDLPRPFKLLAGTHDLEVMAGTNVVLRAKADRPLAQAWIEYKPDHPLATPASALAFLGQTGPLQAVAQTAVGNAVWGRIPAQLDNEGSVLTVNFMPWVSGHYVLHVRDRDRLEWHGESELRVQLDPVPNVKLMLPAPSVTAHPKADIQFKFRVTDEIFAVRSVYVEYRKKQPDGVWIGAAKKTVLFDASDFGKKLPGLLAPANRIPLPGPDLRLRYKEMDFAVVWPLRNEGFVDGDLVVVDVCADDFCDIYPTREPGRSHQIELRIISPKQIAQEAAGKLADIEQTLKNLQDMQQKALDTTKETSKAEKIDPKVNDKFIDNDEQTQRRIQDIVGRAPDDGLRRDLNDIRKLLKDNQLTDTPAYRDASKIKGALDSIAKQELPQIEPKLADIRNEMAQAEKNSPTLKKKLDDVAPLQKRVLSGLQELNKELDPSARMDQHRAKLRDLIDRQKALQTELEKMKAMKDALDETNKDDKKFLDKNAKDYQEKVAGKAEEQRNLSKQTADLLEELKSAKDNFQRNDDTDNARKIDNALKIAEPPAQEKQPDANKPENKQPKEKQPDPITKRMKDAANKLKAEKDATNTVQKEQKDIAKEMERALDALDGRQADVTKQEIEKRQKAEKDVTKLQKELKQLQDETKKAEQIQDKEERLKKKEELAAKTAALQEKMQELRRQLARLEEKRAEENINEADKNLDQARKELQNGGNPGEAQKQAQAELDRAKKNLEQAEEELARELLVKIADQLEGLKKRQEALVDRSESLHAKVMKRKSWLSATLDSLEGNIDAQKGIADETDSFKEKLKEAKVFHGILERAKDSMDKAGEVMAARRQLGLDERSPLEKGEGALLKAEELEDEVAQQNDILKHQKQAAKRLAILLDSIKQELAKKPKKKQDEQAAKNDEKNPDEPPPEQKAGIQAADGIPSTAQLKALRAEQLDLLERTEDFAKRHADAANLNDRQMAEARELAEDQARLESLFQQLTIPPDAKEGIQP